MWVINYLSFLILLSNIGFGLTILFWSRVSKKLAAHALDLAIFLSVFATSGSLYLSNVLLIPPCELCWFQRIFMYPLVFILVAAKIRKTPKIWEIVLPLSVFGAAIAAYHYYLQFAPNASSVCGIVGVSVSCTERTFVHYGYITIPWMSLTAFVYITTLMLILGKRDVLK